MTIGLSFEEYFELKLKPRAGADPVFFQAAEQERDGMFPMPLVSVASHLRSRGYDCRPQSLDLLLESGVVRPAGSDAWSQADVDTAAAHFEDCGVFTPYAAMCETLGCRYADFVRALREAAERESKAYRRNLPAVCRSGGRLAVGVPRSHSNATEIRSVAEGIQGDPAQADLFPSSVEIRCEGKA